MRKLALKIVQCMGEDSKLTCDIAQAILRMYLGGKLVGSWLSRVSYVMQ